MSRVRPTPEKAFFDSVTGIIKKNFADVSNEHYLYALAKERSVYAVLEVLESRAQFILERLEQWKHLILWDKDAEPIKSPYPIQREIRDAHAIRHALVNGKFRFCAMNDVYNITWLIVQIKDAEEDEQLKMLRDNL